MPLPADQPDLHFAQLRRTSFAPLEIAKWAQELRVAFDQKRIPEFQAQSVLHWSAALDLLFLAGKPNVVEHGVRHLYRLYPDFDYARNAVQFFNELPGEDERVLPFRDDLTKEVQIARHQESTTVLFLFCDYFHRLGMPLALMHRWLGRLNATLVYVRDFRRLFGLAGIQSLSADRAGTIRELSNLAERLGAARILCYGSSLGVFAALHYGLDLGAEHVLALGGPADLPALRRDGHVPGIMARLRKARLPAEVSLAPLYRAATHPPRASIVYACDNELDHQQALTMQDLPSVTLHPVNGYSGHNVVIEVISRGLFPQMLDTLVADNRS